MPPLVTYTGVNGAADVAGTLFLGKKFFLTARVPLRSGFVKDVESNGGSVVKLEKQADYIIADHVRADAPPGSLSYRFIEAAIKNGQLPSEDDFPAGPPAGTSRPVGSIVPGRTTRTPFTVDEDRELHAWVKAAEASGMRIKGNELYKQLEAKNPRHTAQSWRDRYLKQLAHKPPPELPTPSTDHDQEPSAPTAPAELSRVPTNRPAKRPTARRGGRPSQPARARSNAEETTATPSAGPKPISPVSRPAPGAFHSPTARQAPTTKVEPPHALAEGSPLTDANHSLVTTPDLEQKADNPGDVIDVSEQPIVMPGFEDEDFDDWLNGAETIQNIADDQYDAAWIAMAEKHTVHTADEWRAYYERVVRPVYLRREKHNNLPKAVDKSRFGNIVPDVGTQDYTYRSDNNPHTITVPNPSKRKSPGLDPVQDGKQKRIKVDPPEDALPRSVQSVPPQVQEHISISSDRSSEQQEDEGDVKERSNTVDPEETTSDFEDAVQTQIQQEIFRQSQRQRVALTAENLARSEAVHNPRTDKRAIDIAPDDENKDQDEFAGYLNNLLQGPAAKAQVNEHDLSALKEKHRQLQALAIDDDDDDDDHDEDEEYDGEADVHSADGTIVPNAIRTQDIDPNLENSSPLRQDSPDRIAPLDSDLPPIPYHFSTQDIDPNLEMSSEHEDDDDMHLDLPEPEGGWNLIPSQETSQPQELPTISHDPKSDSPHRHDKGKGRAFELNTQDVLEASTQQPDLDVPDPATQHPSSDATDSQAMNADEIQAFLTHHCSRGMTEDDVVDALFRTSFRPELAEYVLKTFQHGKGMPRGVAGVWTEEDDEAVEGTDAIKLRQLSRKHGDAEVNARLAFLEASRS